jgi:hypothetical protein
MATKQAAYTNHMVCDTLERKQRCFRCWQYRDGKVDEVFHQHLPKYRMSHEAALEALRAMIAINGGWSLAFALHSRMNDRGNEPQAYPGFRGAVESATIRHIMSSGNDWAWFDERFVIV